MKKISITCLLCALTIVTLMMILPTHSSIASTSTAANGAVKLENYALGSSNAPVTIFEFASYSCSHCSAFYKNVMPKLKKNYINTGKVRFIYIDFPSNRYDLMGGALAHCVPPAQYYPFVKTLFANAGTWIRAPKPEKVIIQYAALAGLSGEKAKACMKDSKLLDALVARRTDAIKNYGLQATPTFIFNGSEDKIVGSVPYEEFAARIEKILATK